MLSGLKRLLGQRPPSQEQRLADALAALERGWSLDDFGALRDLADEGMAAAQYELGRRYERAIGVVQNLDDALMWYERAAEQGHAEAQARAGLMLLAGPPESNATGDAARQGALSAPTAPVHDRKDVQRAAQWNRLAAEAGVADAQLRWGLQLAKGIGTEPDLPAAKTWLQRSAEQGDVAGMTAYGVLCAGGYGGPRDHDAAVPWLRRAAEAGHADAQYWLGVVTDAPATVPQELDGPVPPSDAAMSGSATALSEASEVPALARQRGDPNAVADGPIGNGTLAAGGPTATLAAAAGITATTATFTIAAGTTAAGTTAATATAAGTTATIATATASAGPTQRGGSATDWLLQAAEQGHVPAMYRLGLAHWKGEDTPRDLSLAETWLRRAVSRQDVDAMRALAQLQLEQPDNDGVEAASLLWQAAEAGDAPSAALLGELYLEGRGVPRDTVEAARWLVSAGAAARSEAMVALAGLPAQGADVASGQGSGRRWLEAAAERGDIAATHTLGSLHHRGMGVPRDDALAATYYQRAADRGASAAAFYLGMLHADEASPLHDDEAALRWLRVAADRYHALAVCNLATMVHQGRGQHPDPDQAVRILNRAIARGNLPATTLLAEWLTDGRHLPANPQAAHHLLQPALVIGDPLAAAMAAQLHLAHGLPAKTPRLLDLLTRACKDPKPLARRGPRAIAMVRLALAQLLEAQEHAEIDATATATATATTSTTTTATTPATAPATTPKPTQTPEANASVRARIDAQILDLHDSAAHGGMVQAQVWMVRRLEADARFAHDPTLRAAARRWLLAAAARGDIGSLLRLSAESEVGAERGRDPGVEGVHAAPPHDEAPGAADLQSVRFSGWMVAALSNNAIAQRELGKLYLAGDGCDRDPHLASRWLERAAGQGDAAAAALLQTAESTATAATTGTGTSTSTGTSTTSPATDSAASRATDPRAPDRSVGATDAEPWRVVTRYDDPASAESVELIGELTVSLPAPEGRQWTDPWCAAPLSRPFTATRATLAPVRAWTIPGATISAEFVVHAGRTLYLDSSLLLHQAPADHRAMVTEQLLARLADCDGDVDTRWQHDTVLPMHNEGGDTWGHFLVQNLPRALLFLERFPTGKVALPEDHLDQLDVPGPAQLLRLLCIPRERFVPLAPRRHHRFGAVVLMDFLYDFERQLPYPQGVWLVQDSVERAWAQIGAGADTASDTPVESGPSEVATHAAAAAAAPSRPRFIRRVPAALGRQIANDDALRPVLARHGIETTELGNQPITAQIAAWRSGACMVSTIGSDLSNMLFAPRGSTVLSLTPDWFGDDFFYGLAQVCGVRWFEVRCGRQVDPHPVAHRASFAVDPTTFGTALETVLPSPDR